jgi:large subunit ribosomal protein L25
MNESIHISSVKLPDGAKPVINDRDFTIATIAAPTVITTTCAASTTSETCSQEGMCCALANRTTGNTPNVALNSNVCVPS